MTRTALIATPTAQYMLPGIRVREYPTPLPSDWHAPHCGSTELFVRQLVDPASDDADRPLLTYRQSGPGGANPRPLGRDGWIDEALRDYRRTEFGGWPWPSPGHTHGTDTRFAQYPDGRIERPAKVVKPVRKPRGARPFNPVKKATSPWPFLHLAQSNA